MTIELEDYIKKQTKKNKRFRPLTRSSMEKFEYRQFLRGLSRTDNPIKIWESEGRRQEQQLDSFLYTISRLTKHFENETIKIDGKIKMEAHLSNKKQRKNYDSSDNKYVYSLSNEVYNENTKNHIYELAKDKDLYVGVMGGFTNHLQLLNHITQENPKIEVNFVDINPRQIVYNMLLAMQFNELDKYQISVYKKRKDLSLYQISESKDLFPLYAVAYENTLSNFLRTGINEKKKVFIHASNVIDTYYYDADDALYTRRYIHSPENPQPILNSFLENDNIDVGSTMMIVGLKFFSINGLRITPDDIVFIEKNENGFTTYVYENTDEKTKVLNLKRIINNKR